MLFSVGVSQRRVVSIIAPLGDPEVTLPSLMLLFEGRIVSATVSSQLLRLKS